MPLAYSVPSLHQHHREVKNTTCSGGEGEGVVNISKYITRRLDTLVVDALLVDISKQPKRHVPTAQLSLGC